MSQAHILIISSGNPSRNPRPVKEAKTLAAAGYRVTLLTGGSASLSAMDRACLAPIAQAHVLIPDTRSFTARARRWMACRAATLGIESIHSLGASRDLMQKAAVVDADLTIVHNEIPHAIGIKLIKQRRKVAADFEDWYSEDLLPADRRHRPLRLLRHQEKFLLRHATYCTTTSYALAKAMRDAFGENAPQVLTNSFPIQPIIGPRNTHPFPTFYWFSQTVGPGRGLESFLTAWKQTTLPSRLVLQGGISDHYKTTLLDLLPNERKSAIEFLPPCPPDELPSVIAGHDIGLALEESSPANKNLTISNKILQYLNAGLAVVATPTAGHGEVLHNQPQAGIFLDPENIAGNSASLDRLLGQPATISSMQTAARALAESTYCWEREAPKLLALVEKALASRSS